MKVIIVGCGRFGAALTVLLDQTGHQVTVVDQERTAFDRLERDFRGRTVTGVGFDRDVLVRAGIQETDVIASVTPNDNANIVISRISLTRFKVPRVVARLHDPRRAVLYEQLGVQYISTVRWGVHRLEQLITHPGITGVLSLGNGEIEIVEFRAPNSLGGQTVQRILGNDTRLIALTRGGRAQLVDPESLIEPGDILHLAVSREQQGGQRLEALLRKGVPVQGEKEAY